MESLDNIDMLLANMRAGDSNREQAIHKLGEKYNIFAEQDAKVRLKEEQLVYSKAAQPLQQKLVEEVSSSSIKSADLNKANLDKLPVKPQSYQQPFTVFQERESTFITGGAMMDYTEEESESKLH